MTGSAVGAPSPMDRTFPLVLLFPIGWLSWQFSGPGVPAIPVLAALATLAVCGLAWLGPAAALASTVLALIVFRGLRQARWAASRPS